MAATSYLCAQLKALKHGDEGDVRALDKGEKPVNARSVQGYLEHAFGPRLPDAERALQVLLTCDGAISGLGRGHPGSCCMHRAVPQEHAVMHHSIKPETLLNLLASAHMHLR